VKGTNTGTVTDVNGKYSMNVPANATLKFIYFDMADKEVTVGEQRAINVILDAD